MNVPLAILVPLVLLAAIPVAVALLCVNDEMSRRGLAFIGPRETYHDDCTRTTRWCLLWIPLTTTRGTHSTWLDA